MRSDAAIPAPITPDPTTPTAAIDRDVTYSFGALLLRRTDAGVMYLLHRLALLPLLESI